MEEEFKDIEYKDNNSKNEFRFWLIIAIILLVSIFLCVGYLYGKISTENYECSNNPLTYGINKYNEANGEDYICNCYAMNGTSRSFYFDSEKVRLDGLYDLFGETTKQNNVKIIEIPNLDDLLGEN